MKKIILLLLMVVLCLSLTACAQNIEKFCGGGSITWNGYNAYLNDYISYKALFEKGTLTIEKWEYKDDSSSPSGKSGMPTETKTYSYELKGNDTVIIEGDTYTYEVNENRITFNKKLMGIDESWKQ